MTLDEAFDRLDNEVMGIPREAIDLLRDHPRDSRIDEKLQQVLTDVGDEKRWYLADEDFFVGTPVWYSIVAEKHLSKALIDTVIDWFWGENQVESDVLQQQGMYLLVASELAYPGQVTPRVLDRIEKEIQANRELQTIFLIEVLMVSDLALYYPQIERILASTGNEWDVPFIESISINPDPTIARMLREVMKQRMGYPADVDSTEISPIQDNIYLKTLEGRAKPEEHSKSYYHLRGENWWASFKSLSDVFSLDKHREERQKIEQYKAEREAKEAKIRKPEPPVRKVGRNDPCPCGSGKKYKKCCLNR